MSGYASDVLSVLFSYVPVEAEVLLESDEVFAKGDDLSVVLVDVDVSVATEGEIAIDCCGEAWTSASVDAAAAATK